MTDEVKLKSAEKHQEPKKRFLPLGVKMIKLDENRIVLMRFVMGRWTQLSPDEERRLIGVCR